MRKKWEYSASYTIEISYIMAVFCMVMIVLVQQAYRLHDETKSGMYLHQAVEEFRHDEDKKKDEIIRHTQEDAGFLLSMEGIRFELKEGFSRVTGTSDGKTEKGIWNLEISSKVYEPEEFLRKMAALKQLEERNEHPLQKGDAP